MNVSQALQFESYVREHSPIHPSKFFCSAEMRTPMALNKTGVCDDTKIRREVEVLKVTQIHGDCQFGDTPYETTKRRKLVKDGRTEEAENLVVAKPSGRHHIEGSEAVTQSDKNPDQYYVNLYFPKDNTRRTTHYFIGLEEVVQGLEDPRIKPFLKPKPTQQYITVRGVKVENVHRIKCGAFQYDSCEEIGGGDDNGGQTVETVDPVIDLERIFNENHAVLKEIAEKIENLK